MNRSGRLLAGLLIAALVVAYGWAGVSMAGGLGGGGLTSTIDPRVGGTATAPSLTNLYISGRLGIGTATPVYGLDVADNNIFLHGGSETALISKVEAATSGGETNGVFSCARINEGGAGFWMWECKYSSDTFPEQTMFSLEARSGTWSSIGSMLAAANESYAYATQIDPGFRQNNYPVPRIEMGAGGAKSAAGGMTCASNVITVVTVEAHGFAVGDTVNQSPAVDASESVTAFKSTGSPFTVASVADNTHFTYAKTCTNGTDNDVAHVFSDEVDTHIERESQKTLALGVGGNDKLKIYQDALAVQGGVYLTFTDSAATGLISSQTSAATTSATVGALTLKATNALTANDILLDVQDSAGAHLLTVDQEGDATTLGGLTVAGTAGVAVTGVTGTDPALKIPAGTRLNLDGNTGTAQLYNNGGAVGASNIVTSAAVTVGTNISSVGGWIKQTPMTLNTCNDAAEHRVENDATGGKANGKAPKLCICDAQAGQWRNLFNNTLGTSTTCPDT